MDKKFKTFHAQKRMEQRAINDLHLQLIEVFGEYHYQNGGTYKAYIPEKKLKRLRHAIDKISNVRAIYGETNKLITVLHETRQIRHTEYCA